MSVAEVAAVLGTTVTGEGDPDARVLDVVVDSRTVGPGTLFVAIVGERFDGHDFLPVVFAAGAVAAVTSRVPAMRSGLYLVVEDPVAALGRLSRYVVDTASARGLRVVGLTGSQGKTSTKDLLAQVLEPVGPTVAPYGNLNNELGVPLTATRVEADTRFLVVEMGARGLGHIAYLCHLTPPQLGLVLNVGHAHLGEFGSQQAIARAKGELVEALPPDGMAVLNADDPLVWAMRSRTAAPVTAFSTEGEPDWPRALWSSAVAADELGRCRFELHSRDVESEARAEVELRLSGRHHVANAVAATAVAQALGLDLLQTATSLSGARLRSRSRMQLLERADVVVIDDAYNSNPDSARAAVDTLAEIGRARRRRRSVANTWAVLGDMLELGTTAEHEHRSLGRHVAAAGVDRLVAVGEYAVTLAEGAQAAGMAVDQVLAVRDKAEASEHVTHHVGPGDTILVKASRGLALDTVAEEIWVSLPPDLPAPDAADTSRAAATRQTVRSEEPA